jgi:hypothetical protein
MALAEPACALLAAADAAASASVAVAARHVAPVSASPRSSDSATAAKCTPWHESSGAAEKEAHTHAHARTDGRKQSEETPHA